MTDVNTLSAPLDKPAYNVGDTMTRKITGSFIRKTDQVYDSAAKITAQDAAGNPITVTAPTAHIVITDAVSTTLPTKFAPTWVDEQGRTWTASADGQTATAKA